MVETSRKKYPRIASIARRVLATSASLERVFPAAGLIVSKKELT